MTTLYLATGIKEIDELYVQIESIVADIQYFKQKINNITFELQTAQDHYNQVFNSIQYLKSIKCKIVNLREYKIMLSELSEVTQLIKRANAQINEYQSAINLKMKRINELESMITRLKQQYGRIYNFKQ